jgi:hypothetical protein
MEKQMPRSAHSLHAELAIGDRLLRQFFGRTVLLQAHPASRRRRKGPRLAPERPTRHLLPAKHRQRLAVAQPGHPGELIGRRLTAPEAVRA